MKSSVKKKERTDFDIQRIEIELNDGGRVSSEDRKRVSDKMNDSPHNFVFISESSARANLNRIALSHNTLNPANP